MTSQTATPSLLVRGLTMEFDAGGYAVRPLDGLSFDAFDGELVVLLGPSGCGKTTLLSCLAGLLTPTAGAISFRGREVQALGARDLASYRRDTVGVVFQAFNLIPSLSAKGNVMAPLRLAGVGRRPAAQRADDLLDRVGLEGRAHHRPAQLSGGQQQRVAIARALVHDPPLILADEPTAHLDHVQVEGILRLLRELAAAGRTVLISTHDHRVSNIADRVIEMGGAEAPDSGRRQLTMAGGEVLFRQGDPSDLVFVVEDGQVELVRERIDGSEEVLKVVGPGGYFGELGPVLGLPRSATARAVGGALVLGLPVREFRERFGLLPTAVRTTAGGGG